MEIYRATCPPSQNIKTRSINPHLVLRHWHWTFSNRQLFACYWMPSCDLRDGTYWHQADPFFAFRACLLWQRLGLRLPICLDHVQNRNDVTISILFAVVNLYFDIHLIHVDHCFYYSISVYNGADTISCCRSRTQTAQLCCWKYGWYWKPQR